MTQFLSPRQVFENFFDHIDSSKTSSSPYLLFLKRTALSAAKPSIMAQFFVIRQVFANFRQSLCIPPG
jgi:hypothetical protein